MISSKSRPRMSLSEQPRYAAVLKCSYVLATRGMSEPWRPSQTRTISLGGCMITTGGRHETAWEPLRIQMRLPSGEEIWLRGMIVWANPPRRSAQGELEAPGAIGVCFEPEAELPGSYVRLLDECGSMDAPEVTQTTELPAVRSSEDEDELDRMLQRYLKEV